MNVTERFLKYIKFPTASNEESERVPSSECQFHLANHLVNELKSIGVENAYVDDKCYVYAAIPATPGYETKPKIGFISHMDTVSDFASEEIHAVLHENYDGKDVILGTSGRVLETKLFDHLPKLAGRTLITSEGDTILGADDKAGVAEIMTLAECIIKEEIPHGKICIAFTPDEEIGRGADCFNVDGFDADFAYTVDGGMEGEIEFENFNASSAEVYVNGFNIHPGSAKDKMINAALVAMEFNEMLPKNQTPRDTDGYEGFFHLCHMNGNVEKAELEYIIRDHDAVKFQERQQIMRSAEAELNKKYGAGTIRVEIKESYRNMAEIIREHYHLIENAYLAVQRAELHPTIVPIRGGTDGSRLSFMGLPCPNLGTGGFACHGPYEHITKEGMEKAVKILVELVKIYAI